VECLPSLLPPSSIPTRSIRRPWLAWLEKLEDTNNVDRGEGEGGPGGSAIRSRSDLKPSPGPFPIPGSLSPSNDSLRRFRGDGLPLSDPVLPGYRRPALPAIRSPYLGESCWPVPEPAVIVAGGVQLVNGYSASDATAGPN
jgi:hypothetical protein